MKILFYVLIFLIIQNISHAVMAQRHEGKDSLDDFPTPPWATRALIRHVIEPGGFTDQLSVLEPACGAGHMAKVLNEYFGAVEASNIHPHGYGKIKDFTKKSFDNKIMVPFSRALNPSEQKINIVLGLLKINV